MADTGSPLRPGLFQGSVDGVQAWAKYINAERRARLPAGRGQGARLEAVGRRREERHHDRMRRLAGVGRHDRTVPRRHEAAETCKDKAGAATGIPDLAVLQTVRGAAVLAGLVRGVAVGSAVPVHGGCAHVHGRQRSRWTYYKKYGENALHGVYLVPSDLPSTISASTPLFSADQAAGDQGRRRVRRQRRLAPSRPTRRSCRPSRRTTSTFATQRRRLRELRLPPQGGTGAGREHGEGVGLLPAVLRPASDPAGRLRGRGPVRVALVPPVRGQGPQRRARRFLKYDKKPDAFGAQAWVAGESFATGGQRDRRQERAQRPHPRGPARRDQGHPRLRRRRLHRTRPTSAARSAASASSGCR